MVLTEHIIKIYTGLSDNINFELLTKDDKTRLNKINAPQSRKVFIKSHSMLNSILINELKIDINKLEFRYNTHGKPFLNDNLFNNSMLYFSLSHSKSGVVIATSRKHEVGIDLEDNSKRKFESCQKLSERFFSDTEKKYLREALYCQDEFKARFFKIWTLKEAYLKAIGTGINTTLSEISFNITSSKIAFCTKTTSKQLMHSFYTKQLNHYTVSLACATLNKSILQINEYSQ